MKITKNILTYVVWGGLFLVPCIAFVVGGAMFFPFITAKGFIFRILIEVLFGAYAFLAVIEPSYRPKWSWITKSIGIFVLIMFFADLFSANAYKSFWSNYERMEGFVLIFHLLLYYIVASSVLARKQWDWFWNISIGTSAIMSVYGILQLAGKVPIDQGGVRLDGTFGNSAYLAIYLVFNIFLCLYMLVQAGKPTWLKWTYGVIALVEAGVLYYTATRGSILGLIGGLILLALIIVWKEKENKVLRKISYGILIAVVVLVGGFYAVRNTALVQKSPVLSRFVFTSADVEAEGRIYVWPMAIKGFLERPILGWGQESFNFVFNKFYDPRMYNQEQWFDRAHDVVLDWLVAGGLLGFLAYASMYVALLYYVWRKRSHMTAVEKGLITGLIAAYIFHNLFVFDNLVSYILFFSILAFVHTLSTTKKNGEPEMEPKGKFHTKRLSKDIELYLIAPLVVIVVVAGVYFINVPAVEANFTLIQAISPQPSGNVEDNLALFKKVFAYNSFGNSEALEQLVEVSSQIETSQQIPDTTKQDFYNFASQEVQKKVHDTPTDARYLLFAGSFYDAFGQYDTAIPYLQSAVTNSPKKQTIYFELGSAYIGKGDYADAFTTLQTAYNLETDNPDAQIMYAVGAIYAKNTDVLKQMFAVIPQATILSDNRILQAYAGAGEFQSVIAILSARIQQDPTNLQYQLSLASAYLQIGQKQQAITILQTMEKEDPTFKTQGDTYIQQIQATK
jgi:O-antigen ligase/tetratricopeptide (TPR) repeat protein